MARVLIGCETSGVFRRAFLDRGHDAMAAIQAAARGQNKKERP
jgi:hypothetical protein